MLTLPPFEYHSPRTLDEAISLLSRFQGQVKVIAGGTDLLPNMKHRLFTPAHVVGLRGIAGLDSISEDAGTVRLGLRDLSCARWELSAAISASTPGASTTTRPIFGGTRLAFVSRKMGRFVM